MSFPCSNDPVALITGGARRVGAALCRALVAHGWRVVIHARRSVVEAEGLRDELCGSAGGEVASVLAADLREVDCEAILGAAVEAFGRLDALVNNASCYTRTGLLSSSQAEYEEVFRVNYEAPFALMRAFARRGQPGAILNLLDARMDLQDTGSAPYLLSKKALRDATLLCAHAWGKLGIRVNALAPGLVYPPEGVPPAAMEPLLASLPLSHGTSEEELAKAALFLMESPSVTGEILYLDGGMHLPGMPMREKENPQ